MYILYENLCNNISAEEKVKVKRLAYQSRDEKNKTIEKAINEAIKKKDEMYYVNITENEYEYVRSLSCRKNSQRDIYILYLLLVLYKRKLFYLDLIVDQDSIKKEERNYFKIRKNKRYGKVTRATLDKWIGMYRLLERQY